MDKCPDDTIVICSDDDSDSDDVVIIKEEIEVDCEDVIFLSETKPEPVHNESPTTVEDKTSPLLGPELHRAHSLVTGTDKLSIDDSGQPDNNSTTDATSPLDLSRRSDLAMLQQNAKAGEACMAGGSLTDLFNDIKWSLSAAGCADASSVALTLTRDDPVIKSWPVYYPSTDKRRDLQTVKSPTSSPNEAVKIEPAKICSDKSCIDLCTLTSAPYLQINDSTNSGQNSKTFTDDKNIDPGIGPAYVATASSNTSNIGSSLLCQLSDTVTVSADDTTCKPASGQQVYVSSITSTTSDSSNAKQSGLDTAGNSLSSSNIDTILSDDPITRCRQWLTLLDNNPKSCIGSDSSQIQCIVTSSTQDSPAIRRAGSPQFSSANKAGSLKRSMSSSSDAQYYNLLTLPLSQHNPSFKRSASTSGLPSSCQNKITSSKKHMLPQSFKPPKLDAESNSPVTTAVKYLDQNQHQEHNLPPKKQRRCYRGSEKQQCTKCGTDLHGQKSSQCSYGHFTCSKCLQERVKLVLAGKAKESVKCLNVSCDSYYPIYELSQSLPDMVVEILEEKLDNDYVESISDMILKAAEEEMEFEEEAAMSSECSYVQKYEDCPGHWDSMDEREVNKKGYANILLQQGSPEYEYVVVRFFESMVDHSVEVTGVYRVQNPIQWKYYTVKKAEMIQDNEGFGRVVEGNLFHGTSSNAVDAICRKGFDWRLCGKHGTLYGQGSYFATNASYSHQYTDLRKPQSSLMPSMTLQSQGAQSLITSRMHSFYNHPGLASNMRQNLLMNPVPTLPGGSFQFGPMNLSQNTTPNPPSHPTSHGSQHNIGCPFSSNPIGLSIQDTNIGNHGNGCLCPQHAVGSTDLQPMPVPPGQPGPSSGITYAGGNFRPYSRKIIPQPVPIRQISGLPSSALNTTGMQTDQDKFKARMFFAKVLVGSYTTGNPKLRKPPARYTDDPFGKCYDSCVDNMQNPKIFVIFDTTQAYPEYLIEYTYGKSLY